MDNEPEDVPTVASRGFASRARPGDASAETRILSDDSEASRTSAEPPKSSHVTGPSVAHGRHTRAQPTVASPADAVRQDERVRYRLLAFTGIAIPLAAAAFAPFLPGTQAAHSMLYASLALLFVANIGLLIQALNRTPLRALPLGMTWAGAVLGVLGATAFFGLLSAAPMALVLGFYVVGRSSFRSVAIASFAMGALGHACLLFAVVMRWLPDGLIALPSIDVMSFIPLEVLVQGLLGASWLAARQSQSELRATLEELDGAARALALRQALLDEVKNDLEQAAQLGGPGRLTDALLGPFRLGGVIGRGGMGEIYEARTASGEVAAVKVLFPHLLQDAGMRARFVRESEVVASLEVPNVVRVLGIGTPDEGLPYIAMERLRGSDLAEVLRAHGKLDARSSLDLATQVLCGLDAAAKAGIVHRDIKPQNLFYAESDGGRVWKILDFGVSRLVSSGATLTTGQLVGTPRYMAPEQAKGGDIDARADLYALAAVLYRCITGRPPFAGDEMHAVLHRVTHEMPPMPSSFTDLPTDIDAFFALALAKNPAERLEHQHFLAALQDAFASRLDAALRTRADALTKTWPWLT